MDHELVVVLITTGDEQEAEQVATALLQSRLAACVNMLPGLTSLYWWEGRIDRSQEVLLLAKTRRELVPMLVEVVRGAHSYEVFEAVALPILAGNPEYLRWIVDETRITGAEG